MGGSTIHHAFALDHKLQTMVDRASKAEKRLAQTNLIVADEFSMLTADLFYKLSDLCRATAYGRARTQRF